MLAVLASSQSYIGRYMFTCHPADLTCSHLTSADLTSSDLMSAVLASSHLFVS